MGYIYCITNLINGKKYIGQTVRSIQDRFKDHSHQAYRPENDSRPICRAIRKYGIENFSIEQIEEVENDLLNEREKSIGYRNFKLMEKMVIMQPKVEMGDILMMQMILFTYIIWDIAVMLLLKNWDVIGQL